ncbi:SapC family protein [Halomonas sp.]|uniref:SapC family protein n=1 Tax=Halomonas sp. TaxID=1486246 RepID=UPI003F90F11C
MFKQPEALNSEHHATLGLAREPDYSHAANEMLVPVFSGEAWQVAREYTLVFPMEAGLPLAILGFQKGVNAYLGNNGSWWGRYVPAHIRRYPFVAASTKSDDGQQKFSVMVDRSAPQLIADAGQPLFEEGQPSQLLKEVQKVLINLQKDSQRTTQLVKQIEDAGLLVKQSLHIKVKNGEDKGLQGFRIIDLAAFRESTGETLAALNKTGALDLIEAHLCSLTNLQDGLLAKKASGQVGDSGEPPMSLDELFEEGDDDFSFDFDS